MLMEIRILTADDAAEWSRLRLEALRQDPSAFSSSVEEHQALPLEEIKRRLGPSPQFFVIGAFEDSRLVGIAGFHREIGPKTRHKGRVWGVYVSSAKRGQGVGRRMMQMLLARVTELNGLEQVLLSVTSSQTTALALYQSLGFESFGTEPRALNLEGRYLDEHYLIFALKNKADKVHSGS